MPVHSSSARTASATVSSVFSPAPLGTSAVPLMSARSAYVTAGALLLSFTASAVPGRSDSTMTSVSSRVKILLFMISLLSV